MARVIALTGATGFVGQHLINHFRELGWNVRALVRKKSAASDKAGVEWIAGSLSDPNSLARLCDGSDAIIHCAGAIKAQNRDAFFATNGVGTRNLVSAAADTRVKRFVHLSSLAAREPALSDYAASKRAGEDEVSKSPRGTAWTILRPPAVYGPGDRETFKIMRLMTYGFALVPGATSNRTSFIHVADLCRAVSASLLSDKTVGQTLEIRDASDNGYDWHAICDAAAAALGHAVRPLIIPRFVVSPIAHFNQANARLTSGAAMLTPGKVNEMYHENWSVAENRLVELADWHPQYSLEDGLRETFDWYRQAKWL